jgi:hypothetical protein
MTPTAVDYHVDTDALLDEDTGEWQAPSLGREPSISMSLSPFHVPDAVEIRLSSDNKCTISFTYPNDERSERAWHSVSVDKGTEVQLGQRSKKILAIRFSQAREKLSSDSPLLVPSVAGTWCVALPVSSQFACRRNSEIVVKLLAKMLDEIRNQLVDTLVQLAAADTHGTARSI